MRTETESPSSSLRIALVCDFFYPRLGGVEMHIWSLAHHLIRQGHKVIVITHAYSYKREGQTYHRKGVRYLPGPLKVYYCPTLVMTDEDTLPTFTATLPLLRWIWIREGIDIVHAHQATSTMANESLVYAAALGIPTVYTDHSLFGFDDVASVILNRVLQITLAHVCAIVCVSYTCRDNLILRAQIKETTKVHVIPNAVDPSKFTPVSRSGNESDRIKVVIVSRLVYRKGVDLLVGIIPIICKELDSVDFILGGDGPKRLALQEMVEREGLQDRVEFLGAVPHANVPTVLRRGQVFLNCSLTESFCIALLEAASCGLTVVTTNVGGVPEVLPSPEMVLLAEPNVSALVKQLRVAISRRREQSDCGVMDPREMHRRVSTMYSWNRVAQETVGIYERVLAQQQQHEAPTLLERLDRYLELGGMTGWITGLLAMILECWICFVEWWQPEELIDVVPDIPYCAPSDKE